MLRKTITATISENAEFRSKAHRNGDLAAGGAVLGTERLELFGAPGGASSMASSTIFIPLLGRSGRLRRQQIHRRFGHSACARLMIVVRTVRPSYLESTSNHPRCRITRKPNPKPEWR